VLKRALAIGCAAAGLVLPLASGAAPVESVKPAPLAQGGPRIIQIPAAPKAEPKAEPKSEPKAQPKRRVEQPHKQPEAVNPPPPQAPATPSLRAPVQTKSNRKIWI
jgi:hypothetical protein